jgi:hypothetical protein
MNIMREEVFGPVLSMMAFDTERRRNRDCKHRLWPDGTSRQAILKGTPLARAVRSGMVASTARSWRWFAVWRYETVWQWARGGKWGADEFLEVAQLATAHRIKPAHPG